MFRYRRNYRRNTIVASIPINISTNRKVNKLCKILAHQHVLSVLNQLEDYRLTSNEADFKKLVLTLLRAFNNPKWDLFVSQQRVRPVPRVLFSMRGQYFKNNSCQLVIIYYILSIIKKYNISNTNEIWKEIIEHHSISNPEFFEYLHKNRIIIPKDLHQMLYERMSKLYTMYRNEDDYFRLLRVGYCFPDSVAPHTSARLLEEMFSAISKNKVQSWMNSEDLAKRIYIMKKPKQLSLCLSYCRDYDVNQVHSSTNRNVLDEVMIMQTDFPGNIAFQKFTDTITLRIANLIQHLIYRGARLSKPIFTQNFHNMSEYGFSLTTIGIYVILSIGIDNINPLEVSVSDYDERFLQFILIQIKQFDQPFQDMMLHHLVISCPFIHKEKIINSRRQNEQTDESIINDKLFQTSLTLKQWCRLKIRENCTQKNIRQLNLSRKLIDYCSYGLSNSNFASQCIGQVMQNRGDQILHHIRNPIVSSIMQ